MGLLSRISNAARSLLGRSQPVAPQKAQPETEPEPFDMLLDRVREGHPAEQQAAIAKLTERAECSNDREDWHRLAIALFAMRRFDEAIVIWDRLVENAPDQDWMRLNLATAYSQVKQVGLCRYHLGYLAQHASSEELRRTGREQLNGYEAFMGLTEADIELRSRQ